MADYTVEILDKHTRKCYHCKQIFRCDYLRACKEMMRMPILWEEYTYPKHHPLPKGWLKDERWANDRMLELGRKYPNQWVAVYNKEVVSFGPNLAEVERMASEKAVDRPAFCFFAKYFGRYPGISKTRVSD